MTAPNPLTTRAALMEVMEQLKPFEESARGYREDLIREGWNETIAEQIAGSLLIEMNARLLREG